MSNKELTQEEINKIHQAMAIEMMEEIMREMEKGERVYASINQDIILNLIEKKRKRAKLLKLSFRLKRCNRRRNNTFY